MRKKGSSKIRKGSTKNNRLRMYLASDKLARKKMKIKG
jgi:hypothetical protein